MSILPVARTKRPASSLSVAAQTLTGVLGGESATTVPDLLAGLDLTGAERWRAAGLPVAGTSIA